MKPILMLFPILLPIIAGALIRSVTKGERGAVRIYTAVLTVITSIMVWALILRCSRESVDLIRFSQHLVFRLQFDGLGRFFAGIIATLWPLTVSYAFEYLEDDERQTTFFTFFNMAYGITLGVAMSGDLFTMYCFYELLTLSTVPLVIHTMTPEAIRAAKSYFMYCFGGAAFGFISMLYFITGCQSVYSAFMTQLFYLFGFFGFGVKAAIFPFYRWLPQASVAPTPVTALLHAVAVVKAGVFAVMRLTWCCYGPDIIKGSWAQYVAIGFAAFTIVYASSLAVKETHMKRRLAYSTVDNLSYILFGIALMTPAGLAAGMLHMAFHAEMKIMAFFVAGAVLHKTGREYNYEMDGLGYKMKWSFAAFTVSAMALVGIPPFAGFISKWALLMAAADSRDIGGYIGAASILVSALLTAIYMFTLIRRVYFPDADADIEGIKDVKDPSPLMLVPIVVIAVGVLVTGLCAGQIEHAIAGCIADMAHWM